MAGIARIFELAEPVARRKGWKGSSGLWLGVYVLSFAYRHLRPRMARETVTIRESIEPGQQLIITHFPKGTEPVPDVKPSRRARKRQAKATAT